MSTDAIVLLKSDHKDIRKAFNDFQKAGENAHAAKGKIVDRIIELLTVHTYIENEVMYPRVRELPARGGGRRAGVVRGAPRGRRPRSRELAAMKPDDERFTAKTTVLIENVTHHIEEEETDWFPKVREGLGRKVLQDLGAEMIGGPQEGPYAPLGAGRAGEDHRRRHLLSAA